jgi:hypothetical protein
MPNIKFINNPIYNEKGEIDLNNLNNSKVNKKENKDNNTANLDNFSNNISNVNKNNDNKMIDIKSNNFNDEYVNQEQK